MRRHIPHYYAPAFACLLATTACLEPREIPSNAIPTLPASTTPFAVQAIAVGYSHGCSVGAGSFTYCWGRNAYGAVGDGSTIDRSAPVKVSGNVTFSALSAGSGYGHTCALAVIDHKAYCWGDNLKGELGDNSTRQHETPAPVNGGISFQTLSAGGYHTCGLSNTVIYCWGDNRFGKLGTGDTLDVLLPVPVAGALRFQSISAAMWHTCGVTVDGDVYCWGQNVYGQLGDFTLTNSSTPVKSVVGTLKFKQITTGQYHTCALAITGAAYCWGRNGTGQLGDGTSVDRPVPVPVSGGAAFQSVASINNHTCGVTASGDAYCWGMNTYGQLGDGTTQAATIPRPVFGNLKFTSVATGGNGTCGMTTQGTAYCWGFNSGGALGTGDGFNRLVPTAVRAP